jgi:hypothetical protein
MFGMRDNPFEKSISRFVFFLEYSVTVTVSTIMCVCEGHVSSRGPYIFAGRTHFVTETDRFSRRTRVESTLHDRLGLPHIETTTYRLEELTPVHTQTTLLQDDKNSDCDAKHTLTN